MSGTGTVIFEGGNQLLLGGNVLLGGNAWQFTQSSSIAGGGVLTIGPGATVSVDHSSTYPGSITVKGTFALTGNSSVFGVDGALSLDAVGTINNAGVIHASSFVNGGGTIVGNTPTTSAPLVISSIRLGSTALRPLSTGSSEIITLVWTGPAGAGYVVESTGDFTSWTASAAQITILSPSRYQARISIPTHGSVNFFRIRGGPMQPTSP